MKRLVQMTIMLACLNLWAGDTLDRVIAVVNGHPLLQSDLEDATRFEALQQGRRTPVLGEHEWKAAMDRLIERELIRDQMHSQYEPASEEVQQQVKHIRALYPEAKTDEQWKGILKTFGVSGKDLEEQVALELQTLRFIDVRLRPTVHVEREEVETYYREKLVPAVEANGSHADPLPQVAGRIRELLLQQKVNESFVSWMSGLRSQSKIQVIQPASFNESVAKADH